MCPETVGLTEVAGVQDITPHSVSVRTRPGLSLVIQRLAGSSHTCHSTSPLPTVKSTQQESFMRKNTVVGKSVANITKEVRGVGCIQGLRWSGDAGTSQRPLASLILLLSTPAGATGLSNTVFLYIPVCRLHSYPVVISPMIYSH